VEVIGRACFCSCRVLEQVAFQVNSHLRVIADYAFRGCSSLASFRIPASVRRLGISWLTDCSSLTTIIIEFGSPVGTDVYSIPERRFRSGATEIPPAVIFESAAGSIADSVSDTFGHQCIEPALNDDFLEGWNHVFADIVRRIEYQPGWPQVPS
jgi:hypothetical protein